MKKLITIINIFVLLTATAPLVFAQSTKVITLKDGSMLKGKVLQLSDGIYTVETSNLGNVEIQETNVLSITEPGQLNSAASSEAQKALLKSQVQGMQGQILTDQELITEIQGLADDAEIKAIISDPQLMNEVMSFDQNTIQQSDGVQKLMNNPKIQDLMEKIQQKIPTQ